MKTDLKREKQELRKQIKKKILELSIAYCKSADEKISKHALTLPEYENAKVVFWERKMKSIQRRCYRKY